MNTRIKNILYLTCFAALLLVASCAKDKGNYDLSSINEITIDNLITEDRLEVYFGETLAFTPVITQENVTDGKYEYRWYMISRLSSTTYELSNERNLTYNMLLPVGEYSLIYVVRDVNTGISTSLVTPIVVMSEFGNGLVILEEGTQGGDISQILLNGTVHRNLYSKANNGAYIPAPVGSLKGFYFTKAQLGQKSIYFFLTKQGQNSYELDSETYSKGPDITSFLTFNYPAPLEIQAIAMDGSNDANYIIADGQAIYAYANTSVPRWIGYLTGDYYLAPFIISGTNEENYSIPNRAFFIGYDQKHGRFIWYRGFNVGAISSYTTAPEEGSEFDPNQVNKNCVYAGYSNRLAYSNWLMKDETGMHLYQMYPVGSQKAGAGYKKIPYSAEMANAHIFQGSTKLPHIYFAYKNQIFLYDYESNLVREEYSFPVGEEVTALQFSVINKPSYDKRHQVIVTKDELYVATYTGTEGKVYEFKVPPTGILSTPVNSFAGFGKVKDVYYKTGQ